MWIARIIATGLSFFLAGAWVTSASATPLVPIISLLSHWDHHWYIWLPGDPHYEAVEVMAAERGADVPPLVWVFFTERDEPKRQTHYFNDARVAAARGANFSDIAFTMTGTDEGPQDLVVSFVDTAARSIAIEVRFNPGTQLVTQGAGLTNQIGHSGDRLLLVFFRERNAFAQVSHVTIAGVDVAIPQPGENHPVPFSAAYSKNILVSGFAFGERRVDFTNAGFANDSAAAEMDALRFAPSDQRGVFVAVRPDNSRVELVTAIDDALAYYRHRSGNHVLEIEFVPPLPPTNARNADFDSTYRMSLDGFRDLLAGTVHVSEQSDKVTLDWHFQQPVWTRARPLRTTLFAKDHALARIELLPLETRK
jgi:hypothetical protein